MDAKHLEQCRAQLRNGTPLIGALSRYWAVRALARDASPESIRFLAQAVAESEFESVRRAGLIALRRLTDQRSIDSVCAVWAELRHPALAAFLREQGWMGSAPAQVKVLTALRAHRIEELVETGAEIVDPLVEACHDSDIDIARQARLLLPRLRNAAAIDALCLRWSAKREVILADVLAQGGFVSRGPARARVLSALKLGRIEIVTSGRGDIVPPLVQACQDVDPVIAERAFTAAHQLKQVEAQEALCRLVLEREQPLAREIVVTARYAPANPTTRALFYFLTDQWEQYASLDFDQRLLGAAYEAADKTLRCRIAEKARRAGRTEWIAVIAGGRQDRRLNEMTDEEWEAALAVLVESERWPEMWRLAQVTSANWSVRLLVQLKQSDWRPDDKRERDGLSRLMDLALLCNQEPPFLGRLMRCAAPLEGHTDHVSCVAISRDGRTLLSAGNDATVRLWDFFDKQPAKTLSNHADWIACLSLSLDEMLFATGSRDHTANLWSYPNGTLVKRLEGHSGDIHCLAFTPDGRLLTTGSADQTVRLWKMPSGEALTVLKGHSDIVSCLAVSPDGRVLASGSYDNQVRLWSLPSGQARGTLRGHKAMVNCLQFSPDGQTLASAGKDRSVLLWSVTDGTRLSRLKGHRDDISCMAISADGRVLATGSWDSTVRLWSMPSGELIDTLVATGTMDGHSGWVTCLAFSPDDQVLASGGADGTVRLWSVPGGAPLKVLDEHRDRVQCLCFSSDGRMLVSGSWDSRICVWKSELARLRQMPAGRTTWEDMEWTEEVLSNSTLSVPERSWLEFLLALMRWRRRYDIDLGESTRIPVGEFDIEIEG